MNRHWSIRLRDVAESIDYGVTASATREPGAKFLRITDIQDGIVNWDTVPNCVAPERKLNAAVLRDGDIVFARTGATTGKSFLIQQPPVGAVFASYLIRVRPSDRMWPSYLAHYFRSDGYWAQIEARSQGAAQEGVNATKLADLEVPLPTLDEQRRIAAILDNADALRQKRKRAIALLDSLTQSIFLEMFGDPAVNIHDYPVLPLGRVASKFSDGPFGSNLKSEHYVENGVRVVRLQNIGVGEFIDDDAAYISNEHFRRLAKHQCLPGDVLIATLGDPNLRACVQPASLAQALNKADCVQLRPNLDCVLPDYICALINLPSVMTMASGLVLGQTRGRISMGRLRDLELPIAPIALQRQFVEIIGARNALNSHANASMVKANTLFASLQHRAFSGQL